MSIDAVVTNDVRVQLQSTGSCSVVFCIGTIASSRIAATDVTHVHILVHHATVSSVRRVDHVARKQSAFVEVCPGARHANRLFSGRVELDHHGAIHLGPVHVVDTLHVNQVLILTLNS